ncbi:MAG: hypothetical protein A3F40_05035 [Chlamydiae bacterium RIFCSPHIGHO2_12_FULL_27_8]|nr:MAG: hypothetical protein A3F40_05035 [Chlamydiae bacterium RIFCSPHIGHO2_12_FULL_27_8]OGN66497.1 MAG: hypothetical protein A2888_00350 [Chlamydiae bacterium RIFCSPLOWO2_01_FULL_28_7]
MISKEDAKNYLKKMLQIEIGMYNGYKDLDLKVKDPEFKTIFQKLMKDETEHAELVRKLMDLLDKSVK